MKKEIEKGINYLILNDSIIARLINNHPKFTISPNPSSFHAIVESVISQQLSVKAARTIYNRFIEMIGENYSHKDLLNLSVLKVKSIGISQSKANYIHNIASKMLSSPEYFENLKNLSPEKIIEELTSIKGVGVWTAQMMLIFQYGKLNILPLNDVGILNAVKINYNLKDKPKKNELQNISQQWHPYESIACWYLWKSLNNE